MARKVILCRCEDVTLADVQHAVSLGYRDIEEVKRYTGFGTGPCQGKECLRGIVEAIGAAAGAGPGAVSVSTKAALPFTSRPPLVPTELAVLAGGARGAARSRK